MKRAFVFQLIGIVLLNLAFVRFAFAEPPISDFGRNDCQVDADCEDAVAHHRACFHYCKGEECKRPGGVMYCSAFRKNPKSPAPDCAVNAPCIQGYGVSCLNGKCVTRSRPSS